MSGKKTTQTMTNTLIQIAVFSGYLWSALRILSNLRAGGDPKPPKQHITTQIILLLTLASHLFLLEAEIRHGEEIQFSLLTAISSIFWMATCFYCLFSFLYRLDILYSLLILLTALVFAITALLPTGNISPQLNPNIFGTHLILSILAYSIFTIAGLHTVVMAIAQWHLNSGKIPEYTKALPPLLTMEKILFKTIFIGILLLSLSLLTGMFFLEQTRGQVLEFNHKVVFGWLSWGIFVCLFLGRVFLGWRGRVAINCTLIGYAFLFLSYIGTRFVGEVILNT